MPKAYSRDKSINRIFDANLNRAKEGLRVCEEVARFILNDAKLSKELKKVRHSIQQVLEKKIPCLDFLASRNASGDIGQTIYLNELKRSGYPDIFSANIQRVKESIRVLEEFSKLIDKKTPVEFKKLRYKIYEIEKEAVRKISCLYSLKSRS